MAFRFRNFKVYQDAKMVHKEVIKTFGNLPRNHYYIADQIKRSSLSIVLNIAEGSSKQSDKDFNKYIAISLGSLDEIVACLEIAFELGILSKDKFDKLEESYKLISLQLGGFSKRLKQKS